MPLLRRLALIALAVNGWLMPAVESQVPVGAWRLISQRTVEGNPPLFPRGMVLRREEAQGVVKFDGAVPARALPGPSGVAGRERTSISVGPDGKTMSFETTGTEAAGGKPYRYVLMWERQ